MVEMTRLFLICFSFACWTSIFAQPLQVGFYDSVCPEAESIVRNVVRTAVVFNKRIAAGILRTHFHDCFVRGCDASILLDSTPSFEAEKDSPVNNPSLQGYQVIDIAKSKLELLCPGVVSCADILAFAARDSINLVGGPNWPVPAGRKDGTVSLASEVAANIPAPTFNLDQLTQNFAFKGLSQEDLVTLSGAHTIGVSHCTSFTNRLYNFSTINAQDPSLSPLRALNLRFQCPNINPSSNRVVGMDPVTPTVFDNFYYANLGLRLGLFTSDESLLSDPVTLQAVRANGINQGGWFQKFADAMVRLSEIEVNTEGEVRSNCRRTN